MKTYIIAGTYREAAEWALDHDIQPEDFTPVNDPRDLYGLALTNEQVVYTGNYTDRRDFNAVHRAARAALHAGKART